MSRWNLYQKKFKSIQTPRYWPPPMRYSVPSLTRVLKPPSGSRPHSLLLSYVRSPSLKYFYPFLPHTLSYTDIHIDKLSLCFAICPVGLWHLLIKFRRLLPGFVDTRACIFKIRVTFFGHTPYIWENNKGFCCWLVACCCLAPDRSSALIFLRVAWIKRLG